jgi:hypothetical protein
METHESFIESAVTAADELQISGVVWNRCACGQLKPKKGHTCWRCIERDDEFLRLDALIAAGYGSIQQSMIPREIMQRFEIVARKPVVSHEAVARLRKSA